jgi:hypothetical protein
MIIKRYVHNGYYSYENDYCCKDLKHALVGWGAGLAVGIIDSKPVVGYPSTAYTGYNVSTPFKFCPFCGTEIKTEDHIIPAEQIRKEEEEKLQSEINKLNEKLCKLKGESINAH